MGLVGRLMRAVLVVTCVAGGAIPDARAEEIREPLPFLADGAGYPGGRPPALLWPERVRPRDAPGTDLADEDDSTRVADRLPAHVPAFPDVTRLIGPIPDVHADDAGDVTFADDHPERARIERLLAAVRAAYARDIRVEIVVDRDEGAAERRPEDQPDADDLIAAGGTLRIDTRTRAGALVFDDARREVSCPAAASVETALVTPDVVVFLVGPRLAFSVSTMGADGFLLDLDLNISRMGDPLPIPEPAVGRAAPVLDVLALRAPIPVGNGRATLIRLGNARIAVRVTREATAPPEGTAVLALPEFPRALPAPQRFAAGPRPLLSTAADGEPGTGTWDESGVRSHPVPDEWLDAAARAGVRVVPVPPAVAIVEGSPDAVARFLANVQPPHAIRAWRVAAPELRLPVVIGTPWTCARLRLEPARLDVDAEATYERAAAASEVSFRVLGTFVHGTPVGARLRVTIDVVRRAAAEAGERELPLHGRHGSGAPDVAVLDGVAARATHDESVVAPGDHDDGGVSLEVIEVVR